MQTNSNYVNFLMKISRMDEYAHAEITLVNSCVIESVTLSVPEPRCKIVEETKLTYTRCTQVSLIQLLQHCALLC